MFCPKCHQPLDDEEVYICCAAAQIEWRCASCDKVSEGFAFPYGMCPACGGILKPLAAREIDDAAALDAIRTAFEIELGGMSFYMRAARETQEPTLKELFQKFADMEMEHMKTLSRRYHVEIPQPSEGFKLDRAAIYAGIENHPDDPINLFRIAIAFEERAVQFFNKRGAQVAADSIENQLYRELAAEEQEHVEILISALNRYQQGKAGLF